VVTSWRSAAQESGAFELTDVMAWPGDERPESARDQRIIVRRLHAREAGVARFEVRPRWEFGGGPEEVRARPYDAIFRFAVGQLAVWTSFPVRIEGDTAVADLTIGLGDELWAVIGWNSQPDDWTRERAAEAFEAALSYWHDWSANLKVDAAEPGAASLKRSAITVHLLSHAEHDAATAALTSSLPERIGGDRNYDYRFAWVRDASLSLALLARLVKSMKWNAILTGFAVLIQLPTLRCRFVTALTVAPGWNRWNCLQYAVTRIAGRYALVIVPPSNVSSVHWPFLPTAREFTSRVADRCGTNTGNCCDARLTILALIGICPRAAFGNSPWKPITLRVRS